MSICNNSAIKIVVRAAHNIQNDCVINAQTTSAFNFLLSALLAKMKMMAIKAEAPTSVCAPRASSPSHQRHTSARRSVDVRIIAAERVDNAFFIISCLFSLQHAPLV